MKKRICKKLAKRYLDGGSVRRYIHGTDEWEDGGFHVTELIVPRRLHKAILSEAFRRGWNGNHWDHPLRTYDY